jgi:hypothetical protein
MTVTVENAVADFQRRLDEALADATRRWSGRPRQAEVLQVINSSPGDLAAVFDALKRHLLPQISGRFYAAASSRHTAPHVTLSAHSTTHVPASAI